MQFFVATCAALFIMLLCLLQASVMVKTQPGGYADITVADSLYVPTQDGWLLTRSDGTQEIISLPAVIRDSGVEGITISRDVSLNPEEKIGICFDNMRYSAELRENGNLIYSVGTTALARQLRYSGYRMINLQSECSVSIHFYGSENGEYVLDDVYICPVRAIVWNVIYSELTTIVLLAFFIMLAVVCIGAVVIRLIRKKNVSRIVVIAWLTITLIVWAFNDSLLTALTTIPQEISGMLAYMSLMIMPVLLIYFFWISFDKEIKILRIFIYVAIANIFLQCLLSLSGIAMLNKIFPVSHITIVIVIATSMTMLIKQYSTAKKNIANNMLLAALIEMSLAAVISIGCYWMLDGTAYRISFLSGVTLFIFILIAYLLVQEMQEVHDKNLKESELKLQEQLALTDELTDMGNRRAYEKRLFEIEKSLPEDCDAVLIMLDVNGLKLVNDKYGHSAGDELLISAADVIKRIYKEGECFRVGGDEFTVLITQNTDRAAELEQEFFDEIARNNFSNRLKLSVAIGTSHLLRSNGKRISISDWKQEADVLMYRNKLSMNANRVTDREQDLRDIIDTIITTVEAKDIYTASHSNRVSELSLAIGEMLGLSETTMNNLGSAAYLHDLGKIGIPDNILTKPGKLTDVEYDIIKRHSAIGADIIGKAKGLQEISRIILHHHERYDGKGYPGGLSGTEIPLESRIIAIADSIDAMTSKRCYRDSLSIDECRTEIERNVGKMYDPAIASITLEHWDKITDIILLHPKRLGGRI